MLALASLPLAAAAAPTTVSADFAAAEAALGGELGVAAIDTGTGRTIGYRQEQRFPMCSTFKVVLAAAVLAREAREPGLLDRRVSLPRSVFVDWSPITGKHVDGELSVAQLCAATLQYSDNTAGNMLLREVGGPAGLTRYARNRRPALPAGPLGNRAEHGNARRRTGYHDAAGNGAHAAEAVAAGRLAAGRATRLA